MADVKAYVYEVWENGELIDEVKVLAENEEQAYRSVLKMAPYGKDWNFHLKD